MAKELTEAEAIALAKTGWWKGQNPRKIVLFQLWQPRLCMDFGDFHQAVEEALGRSVWTHEFVDYASLKKEFLGDKPAPTIEEIFDVIPADKRIILNLKESEDTEGEEWKGK